MSDDIASAARRVAAEWREGSRPHPGDMDALLPVLDAVAAGQGDEGRVERWARVLCSARGREPDAVVLVGKLWRPAWMAEVDSARAAIALADAERAVGYLTAC